MKYYDLKDKKYYKSQNADNSRIPYNDVLINNLYNRAKNGETIDVSEMVIDDFFDRKVIENNLLYLELQYLLKNNGKLSRIEEIKAILNPPEEEGANE